MDGSGYLTGYCYFGIVIDVHNEIFWCSGHVPLGGDLGEDPGHVGETLSLGWPGNASRSPPEELEEVARNRDVWVSLLKLLPPRSNPRRSGR